MNIRDDARLKQYAVAILAPSAALGLSLLFRPVFESIPFLLFFVATTFAAGCGGFGPGIVSIMFALVAVNIFFFNQPSTPESAVSSLARLGLFAVAALVISWLNGRLKRASQIAAQAREQREATLGGISDGIIAVDANGRVTLMNAAAAGLLGQ